MISEENILQTDFEEKKKIACKEIPGRNNILHCVTRIAFKDLLMGFLKIGEL